ncbi:MAG: hypothetical protein RBS07_12995 [Lentimicrobium sp.]|jgi:hypothetical protein|nr:hypothetical protein [Lentimicrobium sp.]
MKKNIRFLAVILMLLLAISSVNSYSQPAPANQSNGGDVGGAPIGGGTAPIGSGMLLLITMAAGYGVKKVYDIKPENKD